MLSIRKRNLTPPLIILSMTEKKICFLILITKFFNRCFNQETPRVLIVSKVHVPVPFSIQLISLKKQNNINICLFSFITTLILPTRYNLEQNKGQGHMNISHGI